MSKMGTPDNDPRKEWLIREGLAWPITIVNCTNNKVKKRFWGPSVYSGSLFDGIPLKPEGWSNCLSSRFCPPNIDLSGTKICMEGPDRARCYYDCRYNSEKNTTLKIK